ncbi:MAG: hypothetical protein ABIL16_03530 [candidate division WOR-3 bacterium]
MIMVVIAQVANPYGVSRPQDVIRVNIYDEAFANCNRCVDNLQREIYEYFSGSIEFIAYSQLKKSLMIRYINPIDTAKLGDIIRKAGVKGYEIRF